MKKTLSVLALLGILSIAGTQSAEAFSWSNLNPFTWFGNSRCGCQQQPANDCPCPTGYATPCNPCETKAPCNPCQKSIPQQKPCDACDRLQQHMAK